MRPRALAILNWLGFIGVIAVNTLANTLPINGYNTGQISAMYPNLFVPAGFTFGIWSLIYLLMLGYVVTSTGYLWNSPGLQAGRAAAATSPLFLLTCLANAGWMVAWHYLQVTLSVIVMLLLLLLLIRIHVLLQPYRADLRRVRRVFLYNFFVVYLGWISVATVANITALLVHIGWDGFGIAPAYWSMTMIAVATVLGMLFIWLRRDIAYALVIAWALFGIHAGQKAATPAIGYVALGGIFILLLLCAYQLLLQRERRMA